MININYSCPASCPFKYKIVEKIVEEVAAYERKVRGEVEINIISNKKIKELNKNYRDKDAVTDVLSFAWQESDGVKDNNLGQIFISYQKIKKQAKEFKVTVKEEFTRMLVHGMLHLVGYDHIKEGEARKMFAIQEKIVENLK